MFQAGPAATGRADLVATFHPSIDLRGSAMTHSAMEPAFNLGNARRERGAGTEAKMPVFETPVLRSINEQWCQHSFARLVDPSNRPIADSVADTRGGLKDDYRWSCENNAHCGGVAGELIFQRPALATRSLEGGCWRVRFDGWE